MKNIAELHTDHLELISEINFLKTELEILQKLLTKEYSHSIDNKKIKMLDSYNLVFEKNIKELKNLLTEVKKEEKNMVIFSQNKNMEPDEILLPDKDALIHNFYIINKEIRTLKESFYAFIIQSHHEAN
jgi:hypothetical protein